MIIDCHVHLSQFGPYEGRPFPSVRDGLLAAMAGAGIDASLVYPDSEPGTDVADLGTVLGLVRGRAGLWALGTAHVPALQAEAIHQLDGLATAGEIIGIKLYPGFELFHPDAERCHAIYELCIRHSMPVVFHSGETMGEPWREQYNHPDQIAMVARRFPHLRIVVAHFSQPHLEACRAFLLSHPNAHADIAGLAHPEVVERCGRERIVRVLEEVATARPTRVLFGTDWPLCDVEAHLDLVRRLSIPDGTKALILSGNAARVFPLRCGVNQWDRQ